MSTKNRRAPSGQESNFLHWSLSTFVDCIYSTFEVSVFPNPYLWRYFLKHSTVAGFSLGKLRLEPVKLCLFSFSSKVETSAQSRSNCFRKKASAVNKWCRSLLKQCCYCLSGGNVYQKHIAFFPAHKSLQYVSTLQSMIVESFITIAIHPYDFISAFSISICSLVSLQVIGLHRQNSF